MRWCWYIIGMAIGSLSTGHIWFKALAGSMDRFAKTVTLDPINQLVSTLHFALDWILCFSFFTGIFFCKKSSYQHNDSYNQALWCCRGGRFCFEGGTRCGKWVKSSSRESESFFSPTFSSVLSLVLAFYVFFCFVLTLIVCVTLATWHLYNWS